MIQSIIELCCRWAANQVIGPPQVYPQYGDIEGAWASENTNSIEYIEVK